MARRGRGKAGSVRDGAQSEGRMVLAKAESAFVWMMGQYLMKEARGGAGRGAWLLTQPGAPAAQRAGPWENVYMWEAAQLWFEGVSLQGLR